MTLTFLKENTTNSKAPYGNFVCSTRYSIFNESGDLIGQYFIGNAIDYFCCDTEDFGVATCVYSIDKWSNNIINQKDNTIVGKYDLQNEVYLDFENGTYLCTTLAKTMKEISLLISNEQEQAFFTLTKQQEKLASKIVVENRGSIEIISSKKLWIFAGFYYIEKVLQTY